MKSIISMNLRRITFVLNDETADDFDGRHFSPVNPHAQLQSVGKAIAARKTAITSVDRAERYAAAIKACAGTVNPYARAQKAFVAEDRFTIAIKATDVANRTCVGIVSKSGVEDRQGDVVSRAALAAASVELAKAIGAGTVGIDKNHERTLDDVALVGCWFGELSPGVGDPDALYARFSFPTPSQTFDQIRAGKCGGFSWSGEIEFA